jgi:hypothetical protein
MRPSGEVIFGRSLRAVCCRLLVATLLTASSANAAVVLVSTIADDDPIEGLRARADLLKVIGTIPGVVIAPLSKFLKLARMARLNPLELSSAKAAVELGKTTDLTGIVGGSVEEVYGRRVLRLRAFDRAGNLIYRGNLDVSEGSLGLEERHLVSDRLSTALGLSETTRSPSRVVVAHVDEDSEPLETKATAESPSSSVSAPDVRAAESTPTVSAQEQAPRPQPSERFEDPGFQIELGVQGSILNTGIVDNTQNGSCGAGGSGCIGSLGSSLYPGAVGRLQSFPFHARLDALAGLGFIASGSLAGIRIDGSTPGQNATADDLRINGDLVYRLRLGFLTAGAAIFSPSLGLRAGLQISRLDPQGGSAPIVALDRLGARFGVEILEPLGHSVRVVLGGDLMAAPTPGNAVESMLDSQSTVSDGFGFGCELQAHFAGPNASGPTASIRAAYSQFNDCFERVAGAGCSFSGAQTTVDFDALLGWAFY